MKAFNGEMNCFNCEFFEPYYIKTEHGFAKWNSGFCKIKEYFGEDVQPVSFNKGCGRWQYQDEEDNRENYLSSIKFAVAYCALKLEKMTELLENLDE